MNKKNLRILRIHVKINETDMVYNQFTLPLADEQDISICTFFGSDMNPPKTISLFEGDGSIKGFFRALKTALSEKEYDIIHAHSPHCGTLFLAATLFNFRKYASITVATIHDSYPNYKLRNRLLWFPVFACFKRIIFCSNSSFESFPWYFKTLSGHRYNTVQNGLDINRVDRVASNARRKSWERNGFTINAISRLVEIKNPFVLLDAVLQNMDQTSRLIYMGDGPLKESLITKVRKVGLDEQMEFTGVIPRDKVFEHLLNADLFISTSRGEGLPVAVLEVMACACPVILSDIPPHREIAKNVSFIPLVQPDDVAGFAGEIKRFKKMSISERTTIGQQCRKLVEKQFSLSTMHAGYAEIYTQIIGKNLTLTKNH